MLLAHLIAQVNDLPGSLPILASSRASIRGVMISRVLVVCGGRSSEHEVSLRSAREMLQAVAGAGPHPSLRFRRLVIDPQGGFHYDPRAVDGHEVPACPSSVLDLPPSRQALLQALDECDLVFSLLHGTGGEDGSFQGLLESFGVPYVGSGVLSSALCMNKVRFRDWAHGAMPNTPLCDWDVLPRQDWSGSVEPRTLRIGDRLGWPLFVKPACGGSSRGITRVSAPEGLQAAIEEAFRHDDTALLEASVPEAREVEVAILGDGSSDTIVSPVGEIILPQDGWYDYESKYQTQAVKLEIPADLDSTLVRKLQDYALCAYQAAGCRDLARVDFLLGHGKDIYLNEINTLPGFTSISMYSKLIAQAGIPYLELVERLVAMALSRQSQVQA